MENPKYSEEFKQSIANLYKSGKPSRMMLSYIVIEDLGILQMIIYLWLLVLI